MKKGDVIVVGRKSYTLGKVRHYGRGKALGEIKFKREVQKVTLLIGLSRGVNTGDCENGPDSYTSSGVVEALLALREQQLDDPKGVGATVIPAKGTWKGGDEEAIVVDFIFDPEEGMEKTFEEFCDHVLDAAEKISRRFCQKKIIATVKDGAKEEIWDITPA